MRDRACRPRLCIEGAIANGRTSHPRDDERHLPRKRDLLGALRNYKIELFWDQAQLPQVSQ
jgi:hypothetical protein